MKNLHIYSQGKCSVVIEEANGNWSRKIDDFFEGDAIAWEPNAERVSVIEGLDSAGISVSAGTAGKITIKLKPTSKDVGPLNDIYRQNRTAPVLLSVSIVTGVEEVHKLADAVIDVQGSSTGDAAMQSRDFVFVGKDLELDNTEGA